MKFPGYFKSSNFKIIVTALLSIEDAREQKLSALSAGRASKMKFVENIKLMSVIGTSESELPHVVKSTLLDFLIIARKKN